MVTHAALDKVGVRVGPLSRRRDYAWQPPRWLAIAAIGATAVAYALVARSATYPMIPLDSMAIIGDSRVIAGSGDAWALTGGGFMPGLAVLVAPVWWFTSDPVAVYQIGIWITVALALATIWPLATLARRVGATREGAIIMACIVMVAPARILVVNYLLSETLLVFATALVAAAGIRLLRTQRIGDATLFGLAVGLAVLAHGRGAAIAVAAGLWCLLLLRVCARPALVAGAVALLSSLAAFALYLLISPQSFGSDARVDDTIGNVTATSFNDMVATLVGELWNATLAWPLVLLLGAGLVVAHLRSKRDMALIFLMVVTTVVLSTSQLTHPATVHRIDPWFYGRYNDHVWTLLAVAGLAAAVRWVWPAVLAAVTGIAAGAALLMYFVTVPHISAVDGWQDLHIFGVAPWLSLARQANGEPQQWALICALGVVLTAVLGILSLVRAWIVPTLAIGWLALSLTYDATVIDVNNGSRDPNAPRWGFNYLPPGTAIGIDSSAAELRNLIIFAAGDHPIVNVDVASQHPGVEIVYTAAANKAPIGDGARVFLPGSGGAIYAWVYPGELSTELDGEGLLRVGDQDPEP